MKKPIVIAIAAVSGGGKTTIIGELNKLLPLSKALYFDDYDFDEYPDDFFEWVKSGADYNAWNLGKLVDDIECLILQDNLNCILLDYPFAYKNDKIAPYIDYAIFIDTPLDVAMARRILRDTENQSIDSLREDLNWYLSHGRIGYLEAIKTVKPNSDFVIDGSLSVEEILNEIQKQQILSH